MARETPAANILGTLGTVLWCIQLIPQIVHNWRKKNCEGLRPIMMFLWAASGIPFGIYFVSRRSSIPIMIQPHVFMALCIVSWAQSLHYPPVETPKRTLLAVVGCFILIAIGLEAGFVFPCRTAYDKGTGWPSLVFGIVASVLLTLGLIPPYVELAKRKGRVIGVNFIFLAMDLSGAVLSALSLVFARERDVMGIFLYCIVGFMELGIMASHIIWWLRFGREESRRAERNRRAKESEDADHIEKCEDMGTDTGSALEDVPTAV